MTYWQILLKQKNIQAIDLNQCFIDSGENDKAEFIQKFLKYLKKKISRFDLDLENDFLSIKKFISADIPELITYFKLQDEIDFIDIRLLYDCYVFKSKESFNDFRLELFHTLDEWKMNYFVYDNLLTFKRYKW